MACIWCSDPASEMQPIGFESNTKYPSWKCSVCRESTFSQTAITFICAYGHVFGTVVDRESFDRCTNGYFDAFLSEKRSPRNIEVV